MIAVEVLQTVEEAIAKAKKEHDTENEIRSPDTNVLLADYFTAFSGVNCGAWIASYLASKCGNFRCKNILETRDVIDRYQEVRPGSVKGLRVFFEMFSTTIYPHPGPPSIPTTIRTVMRRRCLAGAFCPVYPVEGYHQVLEQFLGNMAMMDLPASLILPMYDLKSRAVVTVAADSTIRKSEKEVRTFIFEGTARPLDPVKADQKTMEGFQHYTNRTYSLLDVTQAAGSRVVSHEAHRFTALNEISFELLCQDTSLLFNNPSVVALAVMMYQGSQGRTMLNDISLLSIGTGIVDGSLADRARDGALQWYVFSQDFYAVVIHGGSELVQTQVDAFLYAVIASEFYGTTLNYRYGQYLRIQSMGSSGTPMGEALMSSDNITYSRILRHIGKRTAARYEESIFDFVKTFIFGKKANERLFIEHLVMNDWDKMSTIIDGLDPRSTYE